MMHLYVADVGDGLAAGIYTVSGSMLQIDCGSQQYPNLACHNALMRIFPHAFFLSHFHTDHYNGLFSAKSNSFNIRRAFFPRLPVFPERKVFMAYMLAMAQRVIGSTSGSMEWDFLSEIDRITRGMPGMAGHKFKYRALSEGDTVKTEGAHFKVLWPPKTLNDKKTPAPVKKAITDFKSALQNDPKLKQLHDSINESNTVAQYLCDGSDEVPYPSKERGTGDREEPAACELPENTVRANDSLRAAANHMSLALYEDNRFLFLGDLEKQELQQVARKLAGTSFLATITPHHGTHWHDNLKQVKTVYAVSSVGKKLISKVRPEFKSFGRPCLVTHCNGDIHVYTSFIVGV